MNNKVLAIVERATDGTYSVYTDAEALPFGVIGEGDTITEAIDDFNQVYDAMKTSYEQNNHTVLRVEFEFQHDVRSFLQYYDHYITLAGLHRLTGINPCQLSQYVNGTRTPSPATTQKIQTAIHNFGKELSQVTFA